MFCVKAPLLPPWHQHCFQRYNLYWSGSALHRILATHRDRHTKPVSLSQPHTNPLPPPPTYLLLTIISYHTVAIALIAMIAQLREVVVPIKGTSSSLLVFEGFVHQLELVYGSWISQQLLLA